MTKEKSGFPLRLHAAAGEKANGVASALPASRDQLSCACMSQTQRLLSPRGDWHDAGLDWPLDRLALAGWLLPPSDERLRPIFLSAERLFARRRRLNQEQK